MKKRILGLALALVMILSLLPLTTFAAGPDNLYIYFLGNRASGYSNLTSANTTEYYIAENNTFVKATGVPTDNYVKFTYDKAAALATCTFKNFTLTTTSTSPVLWFNSGTYAINVVLEGENAISGNNVAIRFNNSGNVTITGSGTLTLTSAVTNDAILKKDVTGYLLTIKDTTLNVNGTQTSSAATCIWNKGGPITIDNATVTTRSKYNRGISCASAYNSETTTTATHILTIQNGSNVLCDGVLNQARENGKAQLIAASIVIDNSNVELHRKDSATAAVLTVMPTLVGKFSELGYKDTASNAKYAQLPNVAAGTALSTDVRHFKATHECSAAEADDNNCQTPVKCACGKDFLPAKTHTPAANNDCTKPTVCSNTGCTYEIAPATHTTHTEGQDDGDCTTPILCTNPNCTQVAKAGAEKHTYTRTDCSVDSICSVCNKVAVPAGQHTGGTATCKAKAKCEICSTEYGELGACAPAADDGDCTTDIKCSVCGKTTTAGQAAHKYTDKNDTTCDNAGCTKTRTVDGTENPKTGDNTALVLVATLMVAAAAAFVTTKKFVR